MVAPVRDRAIRRSSRWIQGGERHECEAQPVILFVYFTHTEQTLKVVEAPA
jgi:hypothetical protein